MERSYTLKLCTLRKKSSLILAFCNFLPIQRDYKKTCYRESFTAISVFSLTPTHLPHLQQRSSPPLVSHHHRRHYHPNTPRSHHRDAQRRPNHWQRLAFVGWAEANLGHLGAYSMWRSPPKEKQFLIFYFLDLVECCSFRPWLYWGRWVSKAFLFWKYW